MSRLTDAQMRCLAEILQNAYDAGGNDSRRKIHRRTFALLVACALEDE